MVQVIALWTLHTISHLMSITLLALVVSEWISQECLPRMRNSNHLVCYSYGLCLELLLLLQPFYGPLSGTTRVRRYQKEHSPTHHPDHHTTFISFFHLLRSIASSLFNLRAWQSFCTSSFHVLFGLPLGLEPSTSYCIDFVAQSMSSFLNGKG